MNVHTRSGEDSWEDDYWYDDHPIELNEWWVGHFEEIGPGVYTDGNGNYYVDDDGDGIIDYDAGYVEDDYPEEPDPPTTPPAPDSDTREEGDELPNEEGPQDDNEYNENHVVMPSPLTEFIGSPEYYNRRHDDFRNRYPGRTVPDYYKEYGFYYCAKFQNITRPLLSEVANNFSDIIGKIRTYYNEAKLSSPSTKGIAPILS